METATADRLTQAFRNVLQKHDRESKARTRWERLNGTHEFLVKHMGQLPIEKSRDLVKAEKEMEHAGRMLDAAVHEYHEALREAFNENRVTIRSIA